MIFKQKIPCYVLVFEQTEIIKKTLDFLTSYSNKLEIIIIENPSKNSSEIQKIIDNFGSKGLVARHYLLDENITGNAFTVVIENEIEHIKKHKFVMITDGDVTSSNSEWLREQTKILKHKEVFSCGVTLDMSNLPISTFPEAKDWIPSDISEERDYFEAYTGAHLLMMRSKDLLGFMEWKKENNLSFVDGNLHAYCYEQSKKKWARTKVAKAYHLTWDLYHDRNHPYTQFKLAKSFTETWYHQMTSNFTLRRFK